MTSYQIVEIQGDGISPELSRSVHDTASALHVAVEFVAADLSQGIREREGAEVYSRVEALLRRHKVAIKYPTTTTLENESPNVVLRERCNFSVIHRPVRSIAGIATNFTRKLDLDIVRIATGGTYEDAGRRIGSDIGVSLRVIERTPALRAARFAFTLAQVRGAGVVSASKYTIQKATDGLFEETVQGVARGFPAVPYRRELFDSLLANLVMHPDRYQIVVCPNEYGDFLSDMACGLIGSVGLGESASYSFDDGGAVELALFDPAGGSAPDIAGKNLCNPSAALFAFASALQHLGEHAASRRLRKAVLACIAAGERTADMGGELTTTEFTDRVTRRLQSVLAGA